MKEIGNSGHFSDHELIPVYGTCNSPGCLIEYRSIVHLMCINETSASNLLQNDVQSECIG